MLAILTLPVRCIFITVLVLNNLSSLPVSLQTLSSLTNNMSKQFLYILVFFSVACQSKSDKHRETVVSYETMRYSKQFGIAHFTSYSQLFFVDKNDTSWSLRSDETSKNNIALLSSVVAGFLEELNAQSSRCAVDKIVYYNASLLLQYFKDGKI